jgi:hypothetical protein
MEMPSDKSIDVVLSFFQQRPDVGGFVVQRTGDKIEFDGYFSDEFLGETPEEVYSSMVTIIAAMRSVATALTNRLVEVSGTPEADVKTHIADMYYEITSLARKPPESDEKT